MVQLIVIYNNPLIIEAKERIGFKNTKTDKYVTSISSQTQNVTKVLFGSTAHAVFVDGHFDNYNHIVALVYMDKNNKEHWLPIINKNGQPDYYIYGPNWVNWTFRVNSPQIDIERINSGIERYTAFWARKTMKIDLSDAKFLIKVKKIDIPQKWGKGFSQQANG